ncbi:uncharacterized protein [Typha angustifolia]|uniref:uncharacterized protein n=1 Tax=Typha angustifolia TaxID=59011 RepID=UPI003C2E2D31
MKSLLPKLVGLEQAAFVVGRNIADNTLAAQEVVHSMTTNRTSMLIMTLKLDMEKAYDRVSWEARALTRKPTLPVPVHPSISEPISLINERVDRGQLTSYREGEAQLIHLLYADNLLITVQATESNALSIQELLADYTKLTNQKVNLEKSQLLLLWWIDKERKKMLYNCLGIQMATMPFTYLGVLISDRRVRVQEHQALVDRVGRKLARWKRGAIEKKARSILWESGAGRGLHLQNWNTVTSSKAEGGLAIRKLKETRAALLGKLVFKVLNRQESPWVKLLRAKFGELNPWIPSVPARASWVWRALVNTTVTIRGGCRKQIGNGRTTKAASEPWLSALPWNRQPRQMHPRLLNEEMLISDLIAESRGQADRLVEEAGFDLAFQISTTELTEAVGPDRWI